MNTHPSRGSRINPTLKVCEHNGVAHASSVKHSWSCLSDLWDSQSNANMITVDCKEGNCLAALLAKMSMFNCYMQQSKTPACHVNLKGIFEGLLPCYCYATKANSRTIRSRVSQLASAGKGEDISELKAHNCMSPKQ